MKNIFFSVLLMATATLTTNAQDIALIADPHVMAPELVITRGGQAYNADIANNRKLLEQSAEIFTAIVDSLLAEQPALVLIPGDLTKDGEMVSHQLVANQLARLTQQGIRVLVVPGNHDVDSHAAYQYNGDSRTAVAACSAQEFATLYNDYGYGEALQRDPSSLSYVAEPIQGLRVLALDTRTGELPDASLQWALKQADLAHKEGKRTIAMMHHQLLHHFDGQETVMASSLVQNDEAIRDSLIAHQVGIVMTGHFHFNDISTYVAANGLDSITEISTGSSITYPCSFRWMTLEEQSLTIATRYVNRIGTVDDLLSYSRTWMATHVPVVVESLIGSIWDKAETMLLEKAGSIQGLDEALIRHFLDSVPATTEGKVALFNEYLGEDLTKVVLIHSEGNENENENNTDQLQQDLQDDFSNIIAAITNDGFDGVWKDLFFYKITERQALSLAAPVIWQKIQPIVQSILGDISYMRTADAEGDPIANPQARVTNDLFVGLLFPEVPKDKTTDLDATSKPVSNGVAYDILGRPVSATTEHGVYIQDGKVSVTLPCRHP